MRLQPENHLPSGFVRPHSLSVRRENDARRRNARGQDVRGWNIRLNTLDDVLAFAHTYSAEIRKDAKARRIYRTFAALTNDPFEALLAFSLWKVRGHFSFS